MTEYMNQKRAAKILAKWSRKTVTLSGKSPRMPLRVILSEAMTVAHLVEDNWETKVVDGKTRHGLESVVVRGKVTLETASEIRELIVAINEAQGACRRYQEPIDGEVVAEAQRMLTEFKTGLSYLLEDGEDERGAKQLKQVSNGHADARSLADMPMALEAFAGLAQDYKSELKDFGVFPLNIIDDALGVARRLRVQGEMHHSGGVYQRRRELTTTRNQLIAGLQQRVSAARRTIRYVFKDEPEILHQASSDYKRRSRRRAGNAHDENS